MILEQSHEGYNQATERARKGMLGSSCKEIGLEGWIDLRAQLYLWTESVSSVNRDDSIDGLNWMNVFKTLDMVKGTDEALNKILLLLLLLVMP